MIFVFDSSPLIYLGKVGLLEKLSKLKAELLIPKSVYIEVVDRGIEKGFVDAGYIKSLVNDGIFVIKGVKFKPINGIDEADAETIALAKHVRGTAIIDDQKARSIASIEEVDCVGSAFILLLLVKRGIIGKKEGRNYLDIMIERGWYCSSDFYSTLLKSLE